MCRVISSTPLRKYPTFFREAGLSASEFVAISTEAVKQGVFGDKGVDAIKEATIRLREMSTSTSEALAGIGLFLARDTASNGRWFDDSFRCNTEGKRKTQRATRDK